jgi:hypothetical protein
VGTIGLLIYKSVTHSLLAGQSGVLTYHCGTLEPVAMHDTISILNVDMFLLSSIAFQGDTFSKTGHKVVPIEIVYTTATQSMHRSL